MSGAQRSVTSSVQYMYFVRVSRRSLPSFPGMLILLPLGTTLPVFVHGPEMEGAVAMVILFAVEKRK